MIVVFLLAIVAIGCVLWYATRYDNESVDEVKPNAKVPVIGNHFIPYSRRTLRNGLIRNYSEKDGEYLDKLIDLFDLEFKMMYLDLANDLMTAYEDFEPVRLRDVVVGDPSLKKVLNEEARKKKEEKFLKAFVKLMGKANFLPLTHEDFEFAMSAEYMFTLPVKIKWSHIDDKLFKPFYEKNPDIVDETYNNHVVLPHFQNRVMIFHRGVGVAKTEGKLIGRKFDLLTRKWFSFVVKNFVPKALLNLLKKETDVEPPKAKVVPKQTPAQSSTEVEKQFVERITLQAGLLDFKSLFTESVIQEPTFEEVIVIYRQTKNDPSDHGFNKNNIFIKTFADIPMADLEMVFPEKEIGIKPLDFVRVLGAGVAALAALVATIEESVGFWPTLLAAGFGFIGLLVKCYFDYLFYVTSYQNTVADILYNKNLDSHSGVLVYLLNCLREQELNEALLGYYILSKSEKKLTEKELDTQCESFLASLGQLVDFEVDDALDKLLKLDLVIKEGDGDDAVYSAISNDKALKHLRKAINESKVLKE